MFENDVILQQPADLLRLTEMYVNAASHFIETNASKSIVYLLLPGLCAWARGFKQ